MNRAKKGFVFFYSPLFPFNDHYFVIAALDGTLDYSLETKIVIDLVSAHLLFGKGPNAKRTAAKVSNAAKRVCSLWNSKHSRQEVSKVLAKITRQFY